MPRAALPDHPASANADDADRRRRPVLSPITTPMTTAGSVTVSAWRSTDDEDDRGEAQAMAARQLAAPAQAGREADVLGEDRRDRECPAYRQVEDREGHDDPGHREQPSSPVEVGRPTEEKSESWMVCGVELDGERHDGAAEREQDGRDDEGRAARSRTAPTAAAGDTRRPARAVMAAAVRTQPPRMAEAGRGAAGDRERDRGARSACCTIASSCVREQDRVVDPACGSRASFRASKIRRRCRVVHPDRVDLGRQAEQDVPAARSTVPMTSSGAKARL